MILNRRFASYVLLNRLAFGGMAELFLAMKIGPGRFEKLVVIKCILEQHNDHPGFVRLFYDEAYIAGRFSHPNVIHTYDVDIFEGTHHLVMEHMAGVTVGELIERAEERGVAIPQELIIKLIIDACEGLYYVHTLADEQGRALDIVHRDISPQNIFVTYEGQAKVFDFGVAQMNHREASSQDEQNSMAGTYAYMSPEQCKGEVIDARSDVFSLGVILYEMTTGRRLFARENHIKTLRALVEEPIAPPGEFVKRYPRYLERVVMKALSRDLNARYSDALEMCDDLRKFLKISGSKPTSQSLSTFVEGLFPDKIEAFQKSIREATHAIVEKHGRVHPINAAQNSREMAKLNLSHLSSADQKTIQISSFDASPPKIILVSPGEEQGEEQDGQKDEGTPLDPTPWPPPEDEKIQALFLDQKNAQAQVLALRTQAKGIQRLLFGVAMLLLLVTVVAIVLAMKKPEETPAPFPVSSEARALLYLQTSPSGAKIKLNGENLTSPTPTMIHDLEPEQVVEVTFSRSGYQSSTQKIQLQGDVTHLYSALLPLASLEKQPPTSPQNKTTSAAKKPPPSSPDTPPKPDAETRSVLISTVPTGALITFAGKQLGAAPITLAIPLTGEHVVFADQEGHSTAIIPVNAQSNSPLKIQLGRLKTSKKKLYTAHFNVYPLGASVEINGVYAGVSPLPPLQFKRKKSHTLKVTSTGYTSFSAGVSSPKDDDLRYFVSLSREKDSSPISTFSVKTQPATALIIDGQSLGLTPLDFGALPQGTHLFEFEVIDEGIYHQTSIEMLKKNQKIQLKIPKGELIIHVDQTSKVSVNNKPSGTALASTPYVIQLYTGTHQIQLKAPNKPLSTHTISIKENKSQKLQHRFEEAP